MRPEKKLERRERIILAAQKLFSQFGYRKTSLEEIAQEAGLGKATLYNYVGGKDELFGEVVSRFYEDYLDRQRHTLELAVSSTEKLRQFATVLMERHREALSSLGSQETAPLPVVFRVIHERRQEELDLLAALLQEGVERGEFRPLRPDLAAMMLFGVFKGMLGQLCRQPDGESEVLDVFMSILFEGLRKRPDGGQE